MTARGLQNFVGFQTQLTFTAFGAAVNMHNLGVSIFDAVGGSGSDPAATIAGGGADLSLDLNHTQTPGQ